jgi:hypothetical protein
MIPITLLIDDEFASLSLSDLRSTHLSWSKFNTFIHKKLVSSALSTNYELGYKVILPIENRPEQYYGITSEFTFRNAISVMYNWFDVEGQEKITLYLWNPDSTEIVLQTSSDQQDTLGQGNSEANVPGPMEVDNPETLQINNPEAMVVDQHERGEVDHPEVIVVDQHETGEVDHPEVIEVDQHETGEVDHPEVIVVDQYETVEVDHPESMAVDQPAVEVDEPESMAVDQPETDEVDDPEPISVDQPGTDEVDDPEPISVDQPGTVGISHIATTAASQPRANEDIAGPFTKPLTIDLTKSSAAKTNEPVSKEGTQFDPDSLLKRFSSTGIEKPIQEEDETDEDFRDRYNDYLDLLLDIDKARYVLPCACCLD